MGSSLDDTRREGEGAGEEVSEALWVTEMVWKNIGRGKVTSIEGVCV